MPHARYTDHRLSLLRRSALVVACLLGAAPASAQPKPPPAAQAPITPPQLTVEDKPRYPEGATGEASVVVEILVA